MVIRLDRAEELLGWASLPITDVSSFAPREACLACGSPLTELAAITGEAGERIRAGCCGECGYVGYMDVPSVSWIIDFYLHMWAAEKEKTLAPPPHKPGKKVPTTVAALLSLPIEKSDAICEIGCGYGSALKVLADNGFTALAGVENSENRVRIASEQLGTHISCGNFEGVEVQQELKALAPYRAIYSAHVLEHTHNPAEVVRKAAGLQKEGDYLVLAMPNFVGEPVMSVLFFLPHLHSFSPSSLSALLTKNGYRVLSTDRSTNEETLIVAQKDGAAAVPPAVGGYLAKARGKVARELHTAEYQKNIPMRFSWDKKDASATRLTPASGGLLRNMSKLSSVFGQKGETRSVVLTRTSEDTGFPITFVTGPHPILFYK